MTCLSCEAQYKNLRTGLSFSEVQQLMKTHTEGQYRQLHRNGVLGFWRELKLNLWHSIHGGCYGK